MSMIDTLSDYSHKLPTIRSSDWFLRIPVAAIVIDQGILKVPGMAEQAASQGIPLIVYFLATFAEIAGGLAILLGGLLRNNWFSDLLTRLGGLAIATVIAGVIVKFYFGSFFGWQLQGLLLAAGLFFLLRGNGDVKNRSLI